MWLMLQQEAPCDLVFGAGATHSVQEFVEEDFGYVKLDWREYVTENPRYLRPTEVSLLRADPSEAKRWLGWEPVVTFRDLVRIMMDADLEAAGLPAPGQGKRCLTDSGWRGSGSREGQGVWASLWRSVWTAPPTASVSQRLCAGLGHGSAGHAPLVGLAEAGPELLTGLQNPFDLLPSDTSPASSPEKERPAVGLNRPPLSRVHTFDHERRPDLARRLTGHTF